MELFLKLLVVQALMGAYDTLYHHELTVALPRCPTAGLELRIHAVRAWLYALLFAGLSWYEWHGLWAWLLILIVAAEVLLTLWDFIVEDRTRSLPATERVTHTLLAINGGAAFLLIAMTLPGWMAQPSALVAVDYGWISWFLTVAALGVGVSGLRDGLAAWNLPRLETPLHLDLGGHRRVLVTGGTGFIGGALCRELLRGNHAVTLVSRNPARAALQFSGRVRVVRSAAELAAAEVFDAVINLAGAPVVGAPWTEKRKTVLRASRLDVTRDLLDFVRRAERAPAVWIQASAIGFYGPHAAVPLAEDAARGNGFAAELCSEWENATNELYARGVRRVVLRFGLVFGRSGGALPMMLLPFRFGMGAVAGSGRQRVAWVHLEDLLRAVAWASRDAAVDGVVNVVAPECPDYSRFAGLIGELLHRPVFLRLPAAPLRAVLGEMASMFVDGPEIVPHRLAEAGFEYRFPSLRSALMDLA